MFNLVDILWISFFIGTFCFLIGYIYSPKNKDMLLDIKSLMRLFNQLQKVLTILNEDYHKLSDYFDVLKSESKNKARGKFSEKIWDISKKRFATDNIAFLQGLPEKMADTEEKLKEKYGIH